MQKVTIYLKTEKQPIQSDHISILCYIYSVKTLMLLLQYIYTVLSVLDDDKMLIIIKIIIISMVKQHIYILLVHHRYINMFSYVLTKEMKESNIYLFS